MKHVTYTAALAAGLLLTGCATTDAPTSGLVGANWDVTAISGQAVSADTPATLLFGQDGRVSGDTSCNRYFADYQIDGTKLQIRNAGATKRACAPAAMDQERRFLEVFNAVDHYRMDSAERLVLSTPAGAMITARRVVATPQQTTYACTDGTTIQAAYPTPETARLLYQGREINMTAAVSASGARYVGEGWEWWTKGTTEGTLSPLAAGEAVAAASGKTCTAR